MKERPIPFSAPMVRAILQGRKTQTRRVIKNLDGIWRLVETNYSKEEPNKAFIQDQYGDYHPMPCPFGKQGDRLWVRETWAMSCYPNEEPLYRADYNDSKFIKWEPSIFMPRWASRITLEITNVRVERIQSISENDARSEGIFHNHCGWYIPGNARTGAPTAKKCFRQLWDSINGKKYPWESNPWVFSYEFKVLN